MKLIFTALLVIGIALSVKAQTDSLHAAVYTPKGKPVQMGNVTKQLIILGTTLDIKRFEVYTLTLEPGKKYSSTATDRKNEQLIVVKDGNIKITVNDTAKTVGPGSLALILAGDKIAFENTSAQPVSWYVLNYQTSMENHQRGHDAGPSFLKDWKDLKVTKTDKGETRNVYDRPTTMFERFDVHATVLNNGFDSHAPHTHRAEELILMINGNCQFQIGQEKFQAKNGDAVLMASKVPHAAQNVGTAPCSYYAIQWHLLKGN
ncbi:MAG: cupin domain-containing protein [Mucilaginibacter sp.]